MNLAQYIDHTLLKATATEADIKQLCSEAIKYQFYAVCVNSCYVSLCKQELAGSKVNVAAVVGFPLGATSTASKVFEARNAVEHGADEIDMVINIGMLKDQKLAQLEEEIKQVKQGIGNKVLKVIIETCYLSDTEKRQATELCIKAGADFVKTSTGFGNGGAEVKDIELMKEVLQGQLKIKASGGIRDYQTALQYVQLGVSRIGTSNGVAIVGGQQDKVQDY